MEVLRYKLHGGPPSSWQPPASRHSPENRIQAGLQPPLPALRRVHVTLVRAVSWILAAWIQIPPLSPMSHVLLDKPLNSMCQFPGVKWMPVKIVLPPCLASSGEK